MSASLYPLDLFAAMFADRIRMDAYTAAIAKYVRPGDVVIDLGCGPGVFALLACKAGARRVYAIDIGDVVQVGKKLAAANGFADRIQFICGDSRQVQLPERANVIVSDVRGVLPLCLDAVSTLQDARARLLADGGRLLPLHDTLICAIVEIPYHYGRIAEAWKSVPQLDLSPGLPYVLNSIYRRWLRAENVLSEASSWYTLDYTAGAKSPAAGTVQLPIARDGAGHGLAVWFDTQLGEGIGYSSDPRTGETVYGHMVLPWLEPVRLRQGQICTVNISAHLVGNDYVWQWETMVPAAPGREAVHFRQSTFHGNVFSPSFLKKHSSGFVPELSENGLVERWLLHAMDGKRTLQEIANEAARLFPQVFSRVEQAFNRAADVAEKYAR